MLSVLARSVSHYQNWLFAGFSAYLASLMLSSILPLCRKKTWEYKL